MPAPADDEPRGPLLLLPPSEGKTSGAGPPLELARLSFPELTDARASVLEALVTLCCSDAQRAAEVLGLGPRQREDVARNAALRAAPTARADALYTGVLFEALELRSLPPAARSRASSQVVIVSGLLGAVRPADLVPAYRLSMGVSLPPLGPLASLWRWALAPVLDAEARDRLVVDLRSSTYAAAWRPGRDVAGRTVGVRVLRVGEDGSRSVVSHDAKHTRGVVGRIVLRSPARLEQPRDLRRLLARHLEVGDLHEQRSGWVLDVLTR